MLDFVLVAAAWMLDRQVKTYDASGNLLPDDGEYQRKGAETVYVFGEFMRDNGMLCDGVTVERTREFQLRMSELTEEGQAFARAHLDKWMKSLDRKGTSAAVDSSGLERRLRGFRQRASAKPS
ncbi:hypothetical protein ACI5KX_06190 [Erythrobacter sp. GH1-10]|uniref:hypothetical protein n=1 Tax=Erythrobacter sp. GH1-10 TaxID=3349334 RepID=UPI003877E1B8